MRDLPRFAAPVGDAACRDRRTLVGREAPYQARPGSNRPLGERSVPDRMKVEPIGRIARIVGRDLVAAGIVLLAGMERLVQIADEME